MKGCLAKLNELKFYFCNIIAGSHTVNMYDSNSKGSILRFILIFNLCMQKLKNIIN